MADGVAGLAAFVGAEFGGVDAGEAEGLVEGPGAEAEVDVEADGVGVVDGCDAGAVLVDGSALLVSSAGGGQLGADLR